jgi:hypothetical protein
MKTINLGIGASIFLITSSLTFAEEVDLEVIHRIKQEAFHHSKIMDYVHLIADGV